MEEPQGAERRYVTLTKGPLGELAEGSPPRPETLEVHLSDRCQLRCPYCHSMDTGQPTSYASGLPMLDFAKRCCIISQFERLGGKRLVISGGGEPLLDPEFPAVVRMAVLYGLSVHLYSNGLSVSMFRPARLSEWLPHLESFRVSYHDGMTLRQRAAFVENLICVLNRAREETVISLSILPEGLRETTAAVDLLRAIGSARLTVEIKHMLPTRGQQVAASSKVREFAAALGETGVAVGVAEVANIQISPRCFAPYRAVVLDPFGGLWACCTRAHGLRDDPAWLGDARVDSLDDLLGRRVGWIPGVGAGHCKTCSDRDRAFNAQAAIAAWHN